MERTAATDFWETGFFRDETPPRRAFEPVLESEPFDVVDEGGCDEGGCDAPPW